MAKDKLKEAEYKAEGLRRAKERNRWRKKIAVVKFNMKSRFREAQRDGYFDY